MLGQKIDKENHLSEAEIREVSSQALSKINFSGKRVLIIIPDSTRTVPLPLFFRIFTNELQVRTKTLDFLIALGTHPPMSDEKINLLLGITGEERKSKYPRTKILNHQWDNPDALTEIGKITAEEVHQISRGLLQEEVTVEINKTIFDYDHLIILSPVFPHEVVGFSGGYKYFFPGIAGAKVLHFFHWLGALITNPVINGTKDTPVREIVNKAASFVNIPTTCITLTMKSQNVAGLFVGEVEESWSQAADLSKEINIVYKDRPFHKVLAVAPPMYDDIWTAGKCMYKLEPIVADGGTLIIYAPHIDEVSYTHGKLIDEVGYHTRDYFLKQMDKFENVPRAILAHSTHVKGIGTFEEGVEKPRVEVVLATAIPEERCKRINLGYLNPDSIRSEEYADREQEGILLVRKAGEVLYRLSDGSVPRIEALYKRKR